MVVLQLIPREAWAELYQTSEEQQDITATVLKLLLVNNFIKSNTIEIVLTYECCCECFSERSLECSSESFSEVWTGSWCRYAFRKTFRETFSSVKKASSKKFTRTFIAASLIFVAFGSPFQS